MPTVPPMMGWGMGGGLGVKLANPDRPVVAVVGDGSSMMTVQALWTAANANIPVVCGPKMLEKAKAVLNDFEYIGLAEEFAIPVRFVGVGESIEDLRPFSAEEFVDALFGD